MDMDTEQATSNGAKLPALGKHNLGVKKIVGVKAKNDKIQWVKLEGVEYPLLCWTNTTMKNRLPIEVGSTAEATIEVKENTQPSTGETVTEAWLVFFSAHRAGGGGGGGGYKTPPKDEAAIVCQTIVKEACESARAEALQKNSQFDMARAESIAAGLVGIYIASYAKVKGAHGS